MLNVMGIDHVGIRVRDKERAVAFYRALGFEQLNDAGFELGHPIIMRHPSGVVINLLGPATAEEGPNILMDVPSKHPGYTHMALRVESLDLAREFMQAHDIEITGGFEFGGVRAFFIRDPDRNVIEFDEYEGDEPDTRASRES